MPRTFSVVVPLSITRKIPATSATAPRGSPADAKVAERMMIAKPGLVYPANVALSEQVTLLIDLVVQAAAQSAGQQGLPGIA